jgi:two-component system aerobic respiration control sensor histidine kinase ArcB
MQNEKEKDAINKLFLNEIVFRMPGYVFWKNRQYVYLGCNENLVKAAGLSSPADFIGKTDYELPWSSHANEFQQDDESVMQSGLPKLNIEEKLVHTNGEISIVLTNKVPLKDANGVVIGIIAIASDITERKNIEQQLILSKELAEAASLAKTEFIANMSHDIRTPLAGVCGLSEILELTLEDPKQKNDAHLLHESGQELLKMLNDMLDDIKADKSSEKDIKSEIIDLHQCIQNLIKLEGPTITVKQLTVNYHIDEDIPNYIISDRKKIHRILLNLVGNAIKFTPSGAIFIHVKCLERTLSHVHVQFSVADTGIGIPRELQSKVFDRFFRANPSYHGIYKGYGLGLHIAHAYANLLGGHITLNSQENVGSTFYFDLTCEIAASPISKDHSKEHLSSLSTSTTNKKIPHLLLVEDNPIALRVLQATVSNIGCYFTSAINGTAALELIKSTPFDFVITDIGLPDISGIQLTERIREWEKEQNKSSMPIIGLTGHVKETAMVECLYSGMNGVFSKPATMEAVSSWLQQY